MQTIHSYCKNTIVALCVAAIAIFFSSIASAQSAWDHYQKAIEYQKAGMNLRSAVDEMKKAIEKDPENAFYLSALGLLYFNLSDCVSATPPLKKAIRLNPEILDAHTALGACLTMSNNYYEAIKEFNTALSLNPADKTDVATIYNNLGQLNNLIGNQSEAENSLKKAIESDASLVTSYINLGNLFSTQNKQQAAVEMYQKAISIAPDYALAYNNLAFAYIGMEKYSDALAVLDKALKIEPDNQYFIDNRKSVELMAREPEKYQDGKLKGLPKELVLKPRPGSTSGPGSKPGTPANVEPSTMVVASAPAADKDNAAPEKQQTNNAGPQKTQQEKPAADTKTPDAAATAPVEKPAPAAEPKIDKKRKKETYQEPELTPEQKAHDFYRAAKYNLSNGILVSAEKDIRRALELFPDNIEFLTTYGYILNKTGDYDAAITQLNKALAFQPENSVALTGLGYAQFKLGNAEEASKSFESANASDPVNGCAAANLAAMLTLNADCGEKPTALHVKAIENKCGQGAVFNNIAFCAYTAGIPEEAFRQSYKAAKLSPRDTVIRENLSFLSKKTGAKINLIQITEEDVDPYKRVATLQPDIPLYTLAQVIPLDFNDIFISNWKSKTILVMPFENPRGVRSWSPTPSEIYTAQIAKSLENSGFFKPVLPTREPIYSFEELKDSGRLRQLAKKYGAELIFVGRLNRVNIKDSSEKKYFGLAKRDFVSAQTSMETVILDAKTLKPLYSGILDGSAQADNTSYGEISYSQLKTIRDEVFDNYCANVAHSLLDHFNLLRYPVEKNIVKIIEDKPKHPFSFHK